MTKEIRVRKKKLLAEEGGGKSIKRKQYDEAESLVGNFSAWNGKGLDLTDGKTGDYFFILQALDTSKISLITMRACTHTHRGRGYYYF